jgi:hypothetical protein
MQEKFAGLQQQVTDQLTQFRDNQTQTTEQLKDSVQTNFSRLGPELCETNKELSSKVQSSLVDLTGKVQELSASNEQKQDALRQVVESRLDKLSESNNEKLEQMRQTVDEKLHTTLEKRLTDSFGLVTEQLGIGGALDLDNLADRVIKPVFKANGLQWKGWHAYRRGPATNLHQLGVPDKVIQAILRHEDVSTTQRSYVKTVPQVVTDAMNQLEARIARAVVQQVAVN